MPSSAHGPTSPQSLLLLLSSDEGDWASAQTGFCHKGVLCNRTCDMDNLSKIVANSYKDHVKQGVLYHLIIIVAMVPHVQHKS